MTVEVPKTTRRLHQTLANKSPAQYKALKNVA
jgi:hypothetical protein